MPKIIFLGTHEFGAGILDSLIKSGQEITAVLTQPDRPVGRRQDIQPSPVKMLAAQHGIAVYQPESLKNYDQIPAHDLAIVCEYGLIVPKSVLDTAPLGNINIHPSLLPKYRGASPIQSALVNGETVTGVTIMLMDEKMDHGAILAQEKVEIDPDDIFVSLSKKLLLVAERLLISTLSAYLEKKIQPQAQNEAEATFCQLFTRDDGRIDWHKSATKIYDLYRGLSPWPGVWTTWNGKRLKLLAIKPANESLSPGIVSAVNGKILVGCAEGSIELFDLQLEGKKTSTAAAFLSGHDLNGAVLK